MMTCNPTTETPGQEIRRNLTRILDLFRAVAAQRELRKALSRTTVNQVRIFGGLFRHGNGGEPARANTPAHDLAVSPGADTI